MKRAGLCSLVASDLRVHVQEFSSGFSKLNIFVLPGQCLRSNDIFQYLRYEVTKLIAGMAIH